MILITRFYNTEQKRAKNRRNRSGPFPKQTQAQSKSFARSTFSVGGESRRKKHVISDTTKRSISQCISAEWLSEGRAFLFVFEDRDLFPRILSPTEKKASCTTAQHRLKQERSKRRLLTEIQQLRTFPAGERASS